MDRNLKNFCRGMFLFIIMSVKHHLEYIAKTFIVINISTRRLFLYSM